MGHKINAPRACAQVSKPSPPLFAGHVQAGVAEDHVFHALKEDAGGIPVGVGVFSVARCSCSK